ncbi:MAG: RidA family protein [Alphaproteobacteria bacterium]|nr:RidA family protein [Alphaproteobacteria bacterium]
MPRQPIDIDVESYKALPYASGVTVSGPVLYTAGFTARDDAGGVVGPGNMAKQFEQIFIRLQQVASAAGTGLEHMVKVTIFVTDIDRAYADPEQWRRYFTGRPASTLVEVSRLKSPEVLVEIEAVFHIPD